MPFGGERATLTGMRSLWWRLVRRGFHLLYHQLAWSYDLVSWLASLGQWRAWQRAALPHVRGERVLELAHGPGHMLLALARAGYRVTGLDLSPQMAKQARRRVRRAGLPVSLVRGRGEALPFAAASFDTVLATFPTPFILEAETVQNVQRVLRPGGRLVIVPQAYLSGGALPARFVNWLYVITGQRPAKRESRLPAAWATRAGDQGFSLEVKWVTLRGSEVMVLVGQFHDGV